MKNIMKVAERLSDWILQQIPGWAINKGLKSRIISATLIATFPLIALVGAFGLISASVSGGSQPTDEAMRGVAVFTASVFGPMLVGLWVVSVFIAGSFSHAICRVNDSVIKIAASAISLVAVWSGVGAVVGMLGGFASPGITVFMRDVLNINSDGLSMPVSGRQVINLSTLGLVVGALLGCLVSARKSLEADTLSRLKIVEIFNLVL
ncbi:hypothetical protein NQ038_07475 [Brevibacterium sp. 50QC2O2]|uniref:hypothetical protein n=1 Tax=Brevibacterium sp. 50QC2O2 TaxID=2968459 RepID=UPI00211CD4DC|nr:hypothetical protein [Brevibacterium sp. 50QC2O2]MCQ9388485.1 hypothetical protein [Brevibacterium sp. 50QC2O2]